MGIKYLPPSEDYYWACGYCDSTYAAQQKNDYCPWCSKWPYLNKLAKVAHRNYEIPDDFK